MEKEYGTALVFVLLCAVSDIKSKRIPVVLLLLFGALSGIFLVTGSADGFRETLAALLPGAALLALGLCTGESIGYGDGWAVLILGLLTGFSCCMTAVTLGLLFSAAGGLALLALKKVNGKSRLPWMPFLAAGYGIACAAFTM